MNISHSVLLQAGGDDAGWVAQRGTAKETDVPMDVKLLRTAGDAQPSPYPCIVVFTQGDGADRSGPTVADPMGRSMVSAGDLWSPRETKTLRFTVVDLVCATRGSDMQKFLVPRTPGPPPFTLSRSTALISTPMRPDPD